MRFAICNEIFQGWDFERVCAFSKQAGYDAIEVAPFTFGPLVTEISGARRRGIRDAAGRAGIEVSGITPLNVDTLVLGESELGVDWTLGPSDRFARYAFNVEVARMLTETERRRLRAIVEYLKPAHTHFVELVEPRSAARADDWELGYSELGDSTALH